MRMKIDRLFLVGFCFILTGFCGLMVEQVFEKSLSTIIGYSAESSALVISIYFAGLSLGAAVYQYLEKYVTAPLKFYALIELMVGFWGILLYLFYSGILDFSVNSYLLMSSTLGSFLAKIIIACGWILVPTLLMGISFPAMTHYLRSQADNINISKAVNHFYGLNILGGFLAVGLAPYFIFPYIGMSSALILCFLIACLVVLLVVSISKSEGHKSNTQNASNISNEIKVDKILILVAFVSGFVFFGAEVLWIHLAGSVIGTSVYAFANTLMAVLAGLYIGNKVIYKLCYPDKIIKNSVFVQLLAINCFALSMTYFLWDFSPHVFLFMSDNVKGFLSGELVRIVIIIFLVTIPSICLGTIFPALFRTEFFTEDNSVKSISIMSAVNALGCISGALISGFFLLPLLGSEQLYKIFIGLIVVLLLVTVSKMYKDMYKQQAYYCIPVCGLLAVVIASGWNYKDLTSGYNVYFNKSHVHDASNIIFLKESLEGGFTSVVDTEYVFQNNEGLRVRTLLTNGKFQGNDAGEVMAQTSFALIPVFHVKNTNKALVIGFGTGQTAHAVHRADFGSIEVVEISSDIVLAAHHLFSHVNDKVLLEDNVKLAIDDGRHHLIKTNNKYDLITIEISSMWFKGATNLYSKEFFELASSRLNEHGVFQQWIQLHHISQKEILSILKTIRYVFPNVELWVSGEQGIVIASKSELQKNRPLIERLKQDEYLSIFGPTYIDTVLETKVLGTSEINKIFEMQKIALNTDGNRYIEFWSPRYNLSPVDYFNINLHMLKELKNLR